MKTLFFLSQLLLLCLLKADAKSVPSGIYLNANDFNNQKLSFASTPQNRVSVRLHDIFYKPFITVNDGGKKTNYPKNSIFGYRGRDSVSYRFFNKGTYEVLNRGSFPLLYKLDMMTSGKGPQHTITYYFSKDASSPLLLLTRANIKAAFADNPAFAEHVYDSFRSDDDLIQYDHYHKAYKLSRIYQSQFAAVN